MARNIHDRSTYDAAQHLKAARDYYTACIWFNEVYAEWNRYRDTEGEHELETATRCRDIAEAQMEDWERTLECVNMSDDEYRDLMNGIAFDEYEAQQEEAHLFHYEGGHDDEGCTIR